MKRSWIDSIIAEWGFIWFPLVLIAIIASFKYFTTSEINFAVDILTIYSVLLSLGTLVVLKIKRIEKELLDGQHASLKTYETWPVEEVFQSFRQAKHRIYILTTWFPNPEYYTHELKRKTGITQIILGNEFVINQREDEFKDSTEENRFSENLRLSKNLPKNVKFTPSPPHMLVMIIDQFVYFAPTLNDRQAMEIPCTRVKSNDGIGKELVANFQRLWEKSKILDS